MDEQDMQALLNLLHDLDGHGLVITDEAALRAQAEALFEGGWLVPSVVDREAKKPTEGVLIPHPDSGW